MARTLEVIGTAAAVMLAVASCARTPAVPADTAVTVAGSGSTMQVAAIEAWRTAFGKIVPNARVDYQPVGSQAGVQDFISGKTAFAGSDAVMNPQQQNQADKRCGGRAFHLPMVVNPIAVIYNLPGVPDLRLSPSTITGIFSGKITRWNDAKIAADNPRTRLPGTAIHAFHRSDESDTSQTLTTFLAGAGGWPYRATRLWWAPGGQGVAGSAAMTQTVQSTDGSIGYVEYGHASAAGLRTAKVRNAAGQFAELTPDSASRGLAGATVTGKNGDLALKLNMATKEPGAYPIVQLTYEIACAHGSPPVLLGFLNHAASNAGQSNLSLLGYAPLPPDLIAKVRASLASMT
ncbi:phosphate ABC transporter substrate-binding protein PstS [Nonomuraea sp. NPDC050536]|uniref:phosphate ABC transporter substrate-binding protein PstS n=1 Tax=Nonomuraea sp. NPDC050536 TaxID=3364366 RepID=UPI0037C6149D